jgi:hypothetical protein
MANVRDDIECNAECWIQELRPKRKEVRRRGKANLRINAIRNNAVVKNRILLWKLREKSKPGSAR